MKRSGIVFGILCYFLCAPLIAEEQATNQQGAAKKIAAALDQMRVELDELRNKHQQLLGDFDRLSKRHLELVQLLKQHGLKPDPSQQASPQAVEQEETVPPADNTVPPADNKVVKPDTVDVQVVAPPVLPSRHADSAEETIAYQRAMKYLNEGKINSSRVVLLDFLDKYQDSSYSDRANYWVGASYYEEGDYKQAMYYFNRVVRGFPDSAKYDDALLKQGYIFYRAKRIDQARLVFEKLLQSDNRRVRTLAQKNLDKMKRSNP